MRGMADGVDEELEQLRSAATTAAELLALTKHMPVPLKQRRPAVATWRRLRDALTAAGVEIPESTQPAEPWALVSYRELRDLRAQRDAVLALHHSTPVGFVVGDRREFRDCCAECEEGEYWPYPTARALGVPARPGRSG